MAYDDANPPSLSFLLGKELGNADYAANPEAFDYFLNKGWLISQGGGGEGGDTGKWYSTRNDLIPDAKNGAKFGTFGSTDPEGAAMQSGIKLHDDKMVYNDPGYGNITPEKNMYHPKDWTSWGYPLMQAGLGLGMGGAIGMVDPEMLGSGMFGGSEGVAGADPTKWMSIGQKADGLSNSGGVGGLAGTALGAFGGQLGGLPDMGSLSKFMPQILQMAAGRGINPMQLIMALTRAGKGS